MKGPEISPGAVIFWALLLLVLPVSWLGAAFLAAAAHEAGHLLALSFLGGRGRLRHLGAFGAVIEAENLSPAGEFFCAAAGPAVSLLLGSLLPLMPRISLCGLAQGLFNLLPLYPLDGGRMVYCLLRGFLPADLAGKAVVSLGNSLIFLLLFLSAFVCFRYQPGPLALVFGLLSMILAKKRKNPCKETF